ncbi:MAG: Adenylate kinase 7 [Paramarteilia canceri]
MASLKNIKKLSTEQPIVLALDDSKDSYEELVVAISGVLSKPNEPKKVQIEEAYLTEELRQKDIDLLQLNIDVEPQAIKEHLDITFSNENGMIQDIDNICSEFLKERNLGPIKVCIIGPPCSGKTTLANMLSRYYKIEILESNKLISEAKEELESIINSVDFDRKLFHKMNIDEAAEMLDQINESISLNERISDQLESRIFSEKLRSPSIVNRGFILDGFPRTKDQAQLIFTTDDTDEAPNEDIDLNNKDILDSLVLLNGSDDFLANIAKNRPFSEKDPGYEEKEFAFKLANFRLIENSEQLQEFFDSRDCYADKIDVEKIDDFNKVFEDICQYIGPTKNYGLTKEERIEKEKRDLEKKKLEERQRIEKENLEKIQYEKHIKEELEKNKKINDRLQLEKEKILEADSLPIRAYLNKFVMPNLTSALERCYRAKPEDPLNFIADNLISEEIKSSYKRFEEMADATKNLGLEGKIAHLLKNWTRD